MNDNEAATCFVSMNIKYTIRRQQNHLGVAALRLARSRRYARKPTPALALARRSARSRSDSTHSQPFSVVRRQSSRAPFGSLARSRRKRKAKPTIARASTSKPSLLDILSIASAMRFTPIKPTSTIDQIIKETQNNQDVPREPQQHLIVTQSRTTKPTQANKANLIHGHQTKKTTAKHSSDKLTIQKKSHLLRLTPFSLYISQNLLLTPLTDETFWKNRNKKTAKLIPETPSQKP